MNFPSNSDSAGQALEVLPIGRSHVVKGSSAGRVTTPSIEMRELRIEIQGFKRDIDAFFWKMVAVNLASMIVLSILVILAAQTG